jgi:integrase
VATQLATLPAGDHTDPAAQGLQLRVRPNSRTWLFRYRWRGQWVRMTIGHVPEMSLSDARNRALELRRVIDDGIDPRRTSPSRRERSPTPSGSRPGDKYSIEYLASEFMARYIRPTRKRPEYAQAILDKDVLSEWKNREARSIKPREVIELLDGIVARGSPVQANRTAALLGQLFKFGIHRQIVEDSPVKLLMRPGGKEKPRERVLSEAEIKAFLSDPLACTRFQRLAHVIKILLLTGQRRGELALARWRDIDLKGRTWTIPDENAKTGRGHIVPLSDFAVLEFDALRRKAKRPTWVLAADTGDGPLDAKLLTRGLAKCLERFKARKVQAFTLHDLRRTCRTGLARLKVAPHVAERVLNHVQERIPGTYDRHEYADEKRAALEKWAEHLKGLVP